MITARLTKTERLSLNLSEKFIQYCRLNPTYAAKVIFNIELTWFQRKTLNKIWFKNFNLLLFGRGIGKTWLASLAVTLYAILYPSTKIGIVTPVFRQAGYFFDYIQELYDSSELFRACCKRRIIRNMNREYLELINGSFIEGLPLGDGNKVRGRRYNFVFIDEYAFVPDDVIKLVIRPMLNIKKKGRDNKLLIASTAYYTWNHFYAQYLFFSLMAWKYPELYGVSEYIYLDLLRIEDPPYNIDVNMLNMSKADTTEQQWAMENSCQFPTEGDNFFPARLIDLATPKRDDGSPIELMGRKDREYVLGIDCARVAGGDNFVIQVLRLDGNIKRLVKTITMNGATYPIMAEQVKQTFLDFNCVRIFIDSMGGGMAIYDLVSQPWINSKTNESVLPLLDMENKDDKRSGYRIIKLIKQTLPLNNDLFHGLKAEMEHGRLLFPITIRRHEFNMIEKVNNEINQTKQELVMLIAEGGTQGFRFSAPSGRKKDRAMSLALANGAAKDYLTVPKSVVASLPQGVWVRS